MERKLPNKNYNRWIMLLVIAIASFSVSFYLFTYYSNDLNGGMSDLSQMGDAGKPEGKIAKEVSLKTNVNAAEGYVDIFLTSNVTLIGTDIILQIPEGITFKQLAEKNLYQDYLLSEADDTLQITGTTGIDTSKVVNPGEDMLFVRVYLDGLTADFIPHFVAKETVALSSDKEFIKVNIK